MPSNEGLGLAGRANPFKVLILGGSYGGLAAALNLLDLCNGRPARFTAATAEPFTHGKIPVDITIVDERDGYYHLISSPLALASTEYARTAWTKFDQIPALKNIRFIHGSVRNVDPKTRLATVAETGTQSQRDLSYDFLVAATGLRRVWPVVPQATTRESYLAEADAHITELQNAREGVVIIGGGAVGIEMAAELKMVMPDLKVTLVHSRDKLCSAEPLPDDFKDRCLTTLQEAGVETIMGDRVVETENVAEDGSTVTSIKLGSGRTIRASKVIYAISRSYPTSQYLPATALDEQGYVKITPALNFPEAVPNSQYHFAVGDVARWPGIKRCGAAMHHGQYAAQNIHQLMLQETQGTKPKLTELAEAPPGIGIAVGKQGVAYYPSEGTKYGEDILRLFFEDDLANRICWDYLQLGKEFPTAAKV
ncbi:Oxidoreductase OXR1 [Exophiala dermatitidis]